MLPDLNRLKVFYHIYSLNSIVGAANRLHLSQPAISQQLQKLEGELRVSLFTRLHKKLVPTAAGERLFTLIEPLINKLQDGIPYIRQPLDRPAGMLRIGAPREFGKEYLPRFCHEFRLLYPDVIFKLKFKESMPLLTMIREGVLDYALVDVAVVVVQVVVMVVLMESAADLGAVDGVAGSVDLVAGVVAQVLPVVFVVLVVLVEAVLEAFVQYLKGQDVCLTVILVHFCFQHYQPEFVAPDYSVVILSLKVFPMQTLWFLHYNNTSFLQKSCSPTKYLHCCPP